MAKGSEPFDPDPGQAILLTRGLRRILAPNPSPMTFRGTNTYLLGTRDIAVIDPGPPDETHLDAITGALQAHQRISHIFVTHSHADHSPLAMTLAQITGAKVHGFGDSRAGRAAIMDGLQDLGGGEGVDETFLPDVALAHGAKVAGSNWTLEAIHTPGHMGNHLCFDWMEANAVFSGDLVMGWASSMVSPPDGHLTDFMTSLDHMSGRASDRIYYPGHGAPIDTPHARVEFLRAHRKSREAQILKALAAGPATPDALAAAIYTDVNPALLPAAARNVLAHLIDLTDRAQVSAEGGLSAEAKFSLI
jgi:glyoxylase-like metal-dependent hydrolase (beta-lactamase superfamily II)